MCRESKHRLLGLRSAAGVSRRAALALVAAAPLVPRPVRAQTAPLRVGATANETFAEAYYAQQAGTFRRAGLDVTVTTFPNGGAAMTGVAGGALDVAIATPMSLAVAIAHGAPLVMVAAGAVFSADAPTTLLCVAKNATIKDPKELEGGAVAFSTLNDTASLAFAQWLDQRGVDRTKVRRIEMPFSEMAAALNRGTVAAAVIAEPSLEVHKSEVRPFANFLAAIAPRFLFSAWYARTDVRAKNPGAIKAFESAIYETARWANAHHAETGDVLARIAKVDPAAIRTMTRTAYAESADPKLIQPALDLAFREKLLERPITVAQMLGQS